MNDTYFKNPDTILFHQKLKKIKELKTELDGTEDSSKRADLLTDIAKIEAGLDSGLNKSIAQTVMNMTNLKQYYNPQDEISRRGFTVESYMKDLNSRVRPEYSPPTYVGGEGSDVVRDIGDLGNTGNK